MIYSSDQGKYPGSKAPPYKSTLFEDGDGNLILRGLQYADTETGMCVATMIRNGFYVIDRVTDSLIDEELYYKPPLKPVEAKGDEYVLESKKCDYLDNIESKQ